MKSSILSILFCFINVVISNGFFPELAHSGQKIDAKDFLVSHEADSPQQSEPAIAELLSNVKSIKGGEPFWVAFKISLQPGWHVYWRNPGDSGMASELAWSLPEGFTATPIQWLPPQRFEMGNIVTFGYVNAAYHLVQITPPQNLAPGTVTLKAAATWLACQDSCMPGMAELTLVLNVASTKSEPSDHHKQFEELVRQVPTQSPTPGTYNITKDKIHVSLPPELSTKNDMVSIFIIPYDKNLIKYTPSPWLEKEGYLWSDIDKNSANKSTKDFKAIVQIHDLREKKVTNTEVLFDYKEGAILDSTSPEQHNFFMLLFFAFLGGLILNAMPCVFPVLSLKAMAIVRESQQHRRHIYLNGIFYTIGVTASFIAMACILLLVKAGGQSVGWGFQMQNPYFIFLLIDLLYVMGLSLSGVFHLPMLFGNTAVGDPYRKNERYSNFWIGVLAVLVATPCTGPFMGIAMGYAFTQEAPTVLLIFLALSLGFSFPFILISFYTPLLKIFPKPGRWMETLKEFMAYPLYLSVAWLLWVLVQQVGDRGLFAALISIIFIRFSIWFWKRYHFDNPVFKGIALVLSMCLVLFPISYIENRVDNVCMKTQVYSKKNLSDLQVQNKSIFVYATAAWCITCKVNELALTSSKTYDLFNKNDVTLMKADWTNHNQEITELLTAYGRSGVPLYVYYPSDGQPILLPQILTESIIRDVIEAKP